MNMIQLTEPPKDDRGYVAFQGSDPTPEWIQSLHELIKQGANIQTEVCSFETISQIEKTLAKQGYTVMFVPAPETVAFARFFLKRTK